MGWKNDITQARKFMHKKWFKYSLVVLWMLVIFLFSAQNGETSSGNNRFIVDVLKGLGIDLDKLLGGNIDFIIRKLAHMSEYFLLMLLSYDAVKKEKRLGRELIIAFFITVVYAATDEFHQLFIPGRAGMLRDVAIDAIGALVAGIVLLKLELDKTKKSRLK